MLLVSKVLSEASISSARPTRKDLYCRVKVSSFLSRLNSFCCRSSFPFWCVLKIWAYFYACSVTSSTSLNISSLASVEPLSSSSLTLSRAAPPLPISWLKSLIPMTKLESYTSCMSFSEELRVTKGARAALGITLSRAAATYFSILELLFSALFAWVMALFLNSR